MNDICVGGGGGGGGGGGYVWEGEEKKEEGEAKTSGNVDTEKPGHRGHIEHRETWRHTTHVNIDT